MDINNSSAIPSQSGNLEAHQNYVNIHGLNELKQQAREDQRAALKPVAQQFEALFVQQVFKESRKVSLDDGWLDGNQGDFYKDWHDKQLAQDLAAKGTLGFADKIVEQLAPSIPVVAQSKDDATKSPEKQQDIHTGEADSVGSPAQLNSTQQAIALRQINR